MVEYEWYITPDEYDAAEQNGISRDTLEHRIRYHGWSKKKAITQPVRRNDKYKKWLAVAINNGIKEETFKQRVYRLKWGYEKAATFKGDKRKKYPNYVYENLKKNNIKYYTFLKRIEKKWDIERACTEPTNNKIDALKKAREIQKELGVGPHKFVENRYKLINARRNNKWICLGE